MIELNINEINKYGITEQPAKYNSEEELIRWLKYDLLQQARKKYKEPNENNIITITDEEEKNYKIKIGNENQKITIDFSIHFISFLNKIGIKSTEINYKIYISNISVNTIHLDNGIFKNDFYFKNNHIKISISFKNTYFYEKAEFQFSSQYGINFYNASFYNELLISNIHFNGMSLNLSDININKNTKLIFNNIIIRTNSSIIIEKEFEEIDTLEFNNISLYGTIILNIKSTNISLTDMGLVGSFVLVNRYFKKIKNSETARILKNDAYQKGNIIKALEYQAEETRLHKEELKEQFKENKNLKTFGDILSIELSSLYSDNGQNWIRALGMTIFITAFCFIVFYIPDLTQSNIIRLYYKNLFPELIKYFIPTDYTLLIKYAESNLHLLLKIFGVLVYFLGKVLFWYGSVQTVTAFRKFAKGA